MSERPYIDDETTTPPQGDELLEGAPHEAGGAAAERTHVDDEQGAPPHGDELLEGEPHAGG